MLDGFSHIFSFFHITDQVPDTQVDNFENKICKPIELIKFLNDCDEENINKVCNKENKLSKIHACTTKGHLVGQVYSEIMNKIVCKI